MSFWSLSPPLIFIPSCTSSPNSSQVSTPPPPPGSLILLPLQPLHTQPWVGPTVSLLSSYPRPLPPGCQKLEGKTTLLSRWSCCPVVGLAQGLATPCSGLLLCSFPDTTGCPCSPPSSGLLLQPFSLIGSQPASLPPRENSHHTQPATSCPRQ